MSVSNRVSSDAVESHVPLNTASAAPSVEKKEGALNGHSAELPPGPNTADVAAKTNEVVVGDGAKLPENNHSNGSLENTHANLSTAQLPDTVPAHMPDYLGPASNPGVGKSQHVAYAAPSIPVTHEVPIEPFKGDYSVLSLQDRVIALSQQKEKVEARYDAAKNKLTYLESKKGQTLDDAKKELIQKKTSNAESAINGMNELYSNKMQQNKAKIDELNKNPESKIKDSPVSKQIEELKSDNKRLADEKVKFELDQKQKLAEGLKPDKIATEAEQLQKSNKEALQKDKHKDLKQQVEDLRRQVDQINKELNELTQIEKQGPRFVDKSVGNSVRQMHLPLRPDGKTPPILEVISDQIKNKLIDPNYTYTYDKPGSFYPDGKEIPVGTKIQGGTIKSLSGGSGGVYALGLMITEPGKQSRFQPMMVVKITDEEPGCRQCGQGNALDNATKEANARIDKQALDAKMSVPLEHPYLNEREVDLIRISIKPGMGVVNEHIVNSSQFGENMTTLTSIRHDDLRYDGFGTDAAGSRLPPVPNKYAKHCVLMGFVKYDGAVEDLMGVGVFGAETRYTSTREIVIRLKKSIVTQEEEISKLETNIDILKTSSKEEDKPLLAESEKQLKSKQTKLESDKALLKTEEANEKKFLSDFEKTKSLAEKGNDLLGSEDLKAIKDAATKARKTIKERTDALIEERDQLIKQHASTKDPTLQEKIKEKVDKINEKLAIEQKKNDQLLDIQNNPLIRLEAALKKVDQKSLKKAMILDLMYENLDNKVQNMHILVQKDGSYKFVFLDYGASLSRTHQLPGGKKPEWANFDKAHGCPVPFADENLAQDPEFAEQIKNMDIEEEISRMKEIASSSGQELHPVTIDRFRARAALLKAAVEKKMTYGQVAEIIYDNKREDAVHVSLSGDRELKGHFYNGVHRAVELCRFAANEEGGTKAEREKKFGEFLEKYFLEGQYKGSEVDFTKVTEQSTLTRATSFFKNLVTS